MPYLTGHTTLIELNHSYYRKHSLTVPLHFVDAALHLTSAVSAPVSLRKNVAHKRLTRCFFIVVVDKITAASVWCICFLAGRARTGSLT